MNAPALLCALLGASLCAQNIVYHDDPNPTTGGGNAFPFGSEGVRTQQLIPGSVLGSIPVVINDLFVNPRVSSNPAYQSSQVYYGDFEIRMGATQLTTLTNDWATNMPNPTTVYRGPLLVNFVKDAWVPLGLPNWYLWLAQPGENLVIDFICWDVLDTGAVPPTVNNYFMDMHRSPTSSISRAYRLGWTTNQQATSAGVDGAGIKLGLLLNDGVFVSHEGTCAGSSGQVPKISANPGSWPIAGQPYDVFLTDGPPNSFAAVVLGFETTTYLGIPLPFDMAPLGAPGCTFWHGWEAFLPPVLTDASGNATFTLQFTLAWPPQTRLYGTWLTLDAAANAFGIVPSGFATMIL
ncbi:MAG: hypothetical protein KAI24_11045 [Planctomycetes bacterium]|nr:hypothetical protein [Planctomycetota bacterium]